MRNLKEVDCSVEHARLTPSDADDKAVERRFEAEMLNIYDRAGHEVGYWATRYLQLVRRRGGLDAARYLLRSAVTSDGYARLRDAGRLDLTVEALVLRPEFASLFTSDELARANDRLSRFRAMPLPPELEPSPSLLAVVDRAAAASATDRIDYCNEEAAHGSAAITAMLRWVEAGRSAGFAVSVIEAVGHGPDRQRAVAALRTISRSKSDWRSIIDAAIERLEGRRSSSPR